MRPVSALLAISFAACSHTPATNTPIPVVVAHADLADPKGSAVGSAEFRQTPHGTIIRIQVSGLPPGVHGMHVHAVGRCEPPSFETAGPHFNPAQNTHGVESEVGPHNGDLPNLVVPASGSTQVELIAPNIDLVLGPTKVLDKDGAALIIHANTDDYKTDPSGNSGSRIACGVIKQ